MKPLLGDVRRRQTLSIGRQLAAIDSDAGKRADANDHHLGQRGDRDSRLVCAGGLDGRRCLRACLGWRVCAKAALSVSASATPTTSDPALNTQTPPQAFFFGSDDECLKLWAAVVAALPDLTGKSSRFFGDAPAASVVGLMMRGRGRALRNRTAAPEGGAS